MHKVLQSPVPQGVLAGSIWQHRNSSPRCFRVSTAPGWEHPLPSKNRSWQLRTAPSSPPSCCWVMHLGAGSSYLSWQGHLESPSLAALGQGSHHLQWVERSAGQICLGQSPAGRGKDHNKDIHHSHCSWGFTTPGVQSAGGERKQPGHRRQRVPSSNTPCDCTGTDTSGVKCSKYNVLALPDRNQISATATYTITTWLSPLSCLHPIFLIPARLHTQLTSQSRQFYGWKFNQKW